jgi:hypothetical protein
MPRLTKQLIYGGAYLSILAFIGVGIYALFIRPGPSCVNGAKDKGEEGVDCGGVCQNICLPPDLKSLVSQNVLLFSPVRGKLAIFAKIQNPNGGLAAHSFNYHITLFGSDGKTPIGVLKGEEYSYAGEVKYITEFVDGYDTWTVGGAELVMEDPEWVNSEKFRKPEFSIQGRRAEITTTTITVGGSIVNRDTIDMPKVAVTAIFYGGAPNSRVLGVSETELDDVRTGDIRPFAVVHPAIRNVDISKTEIVISARRP